MTAEADHVLLLYPVGHSDLNLDGRGLGRGPNFRQIVAVLNGDLLPEAADADAKALLTGADGALKTRSFPILVPIIGHIQTARPDLPIRLVFLLSDQPDPQQSDTVGFDQLVGAWLGTAAGRAAVSARVEVSDSVILRTKVWNYDDAAVAYAEQTPALEERIKQATACFLSAATGTPAMGFSAATVLGADARVTFLYKPNRERPEDPDPRPVEITKFRNLARERALALTDAALAGFDIALAHQILSDPMSGFDSSDKIIATVCRKLDVLKDWHGELYAEAARSARAGGLTAAGSPVTNLVHALQGIPVHNADWPRFWKLKLIDIAVRLQIARARGDVPGFIDRLKHFLDVSLLFGLCWCRLTREARGAVNPHPDICHAFSQATSLDCGFQEEFKQTALLAWRVRNPAGRVKQPLVMAAWLDQYLRLRFLAGNELRDYRNDHIHTTAELERATLDVFVRDQFNPGVAELPPAGGAALIFALVLDTLDALPAFAGEPTVTGILKESLYLPAAVARVPAYDLTEPERSLKKCKELTAPADPASHLLDAFRDVVAAKYAAKLAAESAALATALPPVVANLRAPIMAAATQPGPAAIPERMAALTAALDAWDLAPRPSLVESAAVVNNIQNDLAVRLRKRVFEAAAPDKPPKDVASLADQFARASTVDRRAEILVRLLR